MAQRPERQDRQVEAAAVVGDEVRLVLVDEAREALEHALLVLAFDRAEAAEAVCLVEPEDAEDDGPMGVERRERLVDAGGGGSDIGHDVQGRVGDGFDVQDQVAPGHGWTIRKGSDSP